MNRYFLVALFLLLVGVLFAEAGYSRARPAGIHVPEAFCIAGGISGGGEIFIDGNQLTVLDKASGRPIHVWGSWTCFDVSPVAPLRPPFHSKLPRGADLTNEDD